MHEIYIKPRRIHWFITWQTLPRLEHVSLCARCHYRPYFITICFLSVLLHCHQGCLVTLGCKWMKALFQAEEIANGGCVLIRLFPGSLGRAVCRSDKQNRVSQANLRISFESLKLKRAGIYKKTLCSFFFRHRNFFFRFAAIAEDWGEGARLPTNCNHSYSSPTSSENHYFYFYVV